MSGNTDKVSRIYGKCSKCCIPYSQVSSVQALATHRVIFEYKHWVIYINVFCFVHRRFETWCAEKIYASFSDLTDPTIRAKVLNNNSIWISCSSYSEVMFTDKFKFVSRLMFLNEIIDHLMGLKDNYNPIMDNCEHFKVDFWDWLKTNT